MIVLLSCIIITIVIKSKKTMANTNNNTSSGTYPNPLGANRGLKNFNPGNIEKNGETWQGEIKPSGDSRFKQFKSMIYGIRAVFVLLRTYKNKYGRDTISLIINKWAPKSENNTERYIQNVCTWTGIDRNHKLTTTAEWKKVGKAIIKQETSYIASENEINQAYSML